MLCLVYAIFYHVFFLQISITLKTFFVKYCIYCTGTVGVIFSIYISLGTVVANWVGIAIVSFV